MGQIETLRGNSANDFVREVTAHYIGPRRKSKTIRSSKDAANFMRGILKDEAREHFIALYLDGAHQVVSYSIVSIGSANSTQVAPREVFQGAILVGSVALIVGHNHPSGQVNPSPEDIRVTSIIRESGEILGIKLLDHVIVASEGHYSFTENEILQDKLKSLTDQSA